MEGKFGFKGNLALILVVSFFTFVITSFVFVGINMLEPEYAIKFERDLVDYANIKKFNEARAILKNYFYKDITENDILEGSVAGMTSALNDPYTTYYTKEQMNAFEKASKYSYAGIGVSVRPKGGILVVIDTFQNTPARKVGIEPGDMIVKVDGEDVTTIKDTDLVINMIRGKEGTTVDITVHREGEIDYIDFTVERKTITLENVNSEVLPENIGYISITMFDNDVDRIFTNSLNRLILAGVDGLIIDVRDNPGGNFSQVIAIADALLPQNNLIAYTEDRDGNRQESFSRRQGVIDIPIVVLINENSASASEILAGSLRDNKKALLVGQKTYGKGLVQKLLTLEDGSGLKVTTSRYFTPSGDIIEGAGISPDIRIEQSEEYKRTPVSQIPRSEDLQFKKAIEAIKDM